MLIYRTSVLRQRAVPRLLEHSSVVYSIHMTEPFASVFGKQLQWTMSARGRLESSRGWVGTRCEKRTTPPRTNNTGDKTVLYTLYQPTVINFSTVQAMCEYSILVSQFNQLYSDTAVFSRQDAVQYEACFQHKIFLACTVALGRASRLPDRKMMVLWIH